MLNELPNPKPGSSQKTNQAAIKHRLRESRRRLLVGKDYQHMNKTHKRDQHTREPNRMREYVPRRLGPPFRCEPVLTMRQIHQAFRQVANGITEPHNEQWQPESDTR